MTLPETEPGPQRLRSDEDVRPWLRSIELDGIVDMHVHFLPEPVMSKVWAYFDRAEQHYGMAWPIHYRQPEQERLETLRRLGVLRFAPLVYPHKPGMGEWLTGWAMEFADGEPDAVPTATLALTSSDCPVLLPDALPPR